MFPTMLVTLISCARCRIGRVTFPEVERLIEIQPEAPLANLCFWQGIHLVRGLAVESPGFCDCHLETEGVRQKSHLTNANSLMLLFFCARWACVRYTDWMWKGWSCSWILSKKRYFPFITRRRHFHTFSLDSPGRLLKCKQRCRWRCCSTHPLKPFHVFWFTKTAGNTWQNGWKES